METKRRCARTKCKQTFAVTSKSPNKAYCTERCSTADRVARHRANRRNDLLVDAGAPMVATDTVCKHCGDTFLSVSSSQRGGADDAYCNDKCKTEARGTARKIRRALE